MQKNGDGKTSIFDAVEFALKGEVDRIKELIKRDKIDNEWKGAIYHNREHAKEEASVCIYLSNGRKIIRQVRSVADNASGQYFQYDTEKAKELWAKAQEETDLREINIIYDEEKDFAANTAAFIQSQLESTLDGLTVNISSTPKKNRIQLAQDHDYDIELWAWGPDYADPTVNLSNV